MQRAGSGSINEHCSTLASPLCSELLCLQGSQLIEKSLLLVLFLTLW